MILEYLTTGMFSSNCYVVGDNGEGVIIDPGANYTEILELVEKSGLKIKYIILTHGHIDHICSVDELRSKIDAKVIMHQDDSEFLTNSLFNGAFMMGRNNAFNPADEFVKDKDVLSVGGLIFEIIHTPGHTPGCICIKVGNTLFTGDTLFKTSIGRTDLAKGDYGAIIDSIKTKLMNLDNEVIVYPGHGDSTTIGFEKRHNPFINM
ncbi:MAG: MBL fold metallo-hydrolase [Clostridia bacterium]|nr:MBL fold metallo-hydrolase [Clostridia bacterium]